MASIEEAKEIIKSTPISTIVSFYHPISKKGANFEGICPFHGDSHPSMKINDSKGIYKCFACGAAGDGIKFVQDKLSLDFVDAVKDISGQIGIEIEDRPGQKADPKREMGLRVLAAAAKLYKKYAESGPQLFTEFLKKRNLSAESVADFQLGFAPSNGMLKDYLEKIEGKDGDFAVEVAKKIGLIRDNKHGKGHYDFYRDRVMFPVCDHSGKPRGFSSRAVLPDQKPKYLNSGESFIFDKGNILYGFNLAKKHIREADQVIVVEGNMDAVVLHQFGFKNSVATQGVSLSEISMKLLVNITKKIYLGMDSDPAGIKAMTRINADFLKMGISPKFVDYSPSKDPDEFLNEFGRLELTKRIEEAPSFLDYIIKTNMPEAMPEGTDEKLELLSKVFELIAPLSDGLLAKEKAISVAKSIGLKSSNEDITNEYLNFLESNKPKVYKKAAPKQQPNYDAPPMMEAPHEYMDNFSPDENPSYPVDEQRGVESNISKVELKVLESLLMHPDCILHEQITELLDLIQHFEVKRIVKWLKKIYLEIDESDYPLFIKQKINEAIPSEIKGIMASSLLKHENLKLDKKVMDKTFDDLIWNLKKDALLIEKRTLKQKQKNCDSDLEKMEVMSELIKIEQKLLELKS